MVNLFDEAEVAAKTAKKERKKPPATPLQRKPVAVESDVTVFDIETGPIDEERIRELVPAFDPKSIKDHPGDFNESDVKIGNLKNKALIAEKIEAARNKYNDEVTKWNAIAMTARGDYWRTVMNKAALSPITGKVLAIGYSGDGDSVRIDESADETDLLKAYWDDFQSGAGRYSGWNINGFDVWFLVNRSRLLGIPHPEVLDRSGRYLSTRFVDLMDHWNCGTRSVYDPLAGKSKTGAKAKDVARLLGVGRPADATPVTHGAQFAEFWNGTKAQREQAREYLRWDIREEVGIGRRFGVL